MMVAQNVRRPQAITRRGARKLFQDRSAGSRIRMRSGGGTNGVMPKDPLEKKAWSGVGSASGGSSSEKSPEWAPMGKPLSIRKTDQSPPRRIAGRYPKRVSCLRVDPERRNHVVVIMSHGRTPKKSPSCFTHAAAAMKIAERSRSSLFFF